MFELRMRLTVGLTIAACLFAGAAGAQVSAEAAAQRARIDSMIPEWQGAMRALLYRDSVRRMHEQSRVVALDTAEAGPFMLIARDEQADSIFRDMKAAVNERAPIFSSIPARSAVLFVEWDREEDDALKYRARQAGARSVLLYGHDPATLMRSARVAVDNAAVDFLPAAVRSWLLSPDLGRGRDAQDIYRQIATSPFGTVRGCYNGAASDCVRALQLEGEVQGGALGAAARASFLMFALERGGRGSLAAMHARGDAAPGVAIVATARTSLTELAADWRETIVSSNVSHAGLPRAAVAALIWSIIAALLALRSTRTRAE
jgi:hypothetical protein